MNTIRMLTLLSACGAALLVQPAAGQKRFETLSTFTGTNPIGLSSGDGLVYGATAYLWPTDAEMCGAFFELEPPASPGQSWTQTTIYTLGNTGSNGCIPSAAPILGADGFLYGTTAYGGAYRYGVLYELQPPATPGGAWTESVLYSFDRSGTGTGNPNSLTPGPGGSFYCDAGGGAYGYGALVQLEPPSVPGGAWTQTVLFNFAYGLGTGSLVPGPGGVLYGTNWGGAVAQLSPPAAPGGSWTETVLYTLTPADGLSPNSLVLASDGTLYGTTFGSNYDYGAGYAAVFQLIPPASPGGSWSFAVLKNFGALYTTNLNSPLILRNRNLYGTVTSALGGTSVTGGYVFELQPPAMPGGAWTIVHLHQFTGDQLPGGTLVMDKSGAIFGVTAAPYGQPPGGTVYRLATK